MTWILISVPQYSLRPLDLDWLDAIRVTTTLAAPVLALALKGAPRLLTIAAGLLMMVFAQALAGYV